MWKNEQEYEEWMEETEKLGQMIMDADKEGEKK
jgi:hypothetical protein